jgi:hypothetical protein
MLGNISCSGLPCSRHGLLRDYRLFANGATIVKASKFAKAMSMNRMSARQILRRLTRRKHIFSAHWAIVLVLVLETLMSVKDTDRNTHATFVAMAKGIDSSHSAKATLHAVKRLL